MNYTKSQNIEKMLHQKIGCFVSGNPIVWSLLFNRFSQNNINACIGWYVLHLLWVHLHGIFYQVIINPAEGHVGVNNEIQMFTIPNIVLHSQLANLAGQLTFAEFPFCMQTGKPIFILKIVSKAIFIKRLHLNVHWLSKAIFIKRLHLNVH